MPNYSFSLITCEHDPDNLPYLQELWQSIQQQTYTNWQWVLYLNNGYTPDTLPADIRDDRRVLVFWSIEQQDHIGALKNAAFCLGTGDILVEVDHDDLLLPECLAELNQAYQDPSVGFVYSDDIIYNMGSSFTPFDMSYGWTWRDVVWRGQSYQVMNSFEPTSHALTKIFFAPDHVRSWRSSVYRALGGHDIELSVCDDHELLIRTYLSTKMLRIPRALYVYRVTGRNTWLQRNQLIQDTTEQLFRANARRLAEHDADQLGLMKIDLGGGINGLPGYTVIDQGGQCDIQADLNDGIPLPDNSVGVLNASHVLEHLHDKTKIMSEIHRVLAHGGWAFIEVPSTDGRGAFQDPTHVSYWNENSFLYYTDAYLARFINNRSIRFQEWRRDTGYPNKWMEDLRVSVTTVWLTAVKSGPRLPGLLKI